MNGQDFMEYDDLYVKSNDLTHLNGPTVIALAHNEMYFLPAWLEHYRKLGAERFIVLDDASTDETLAYLSGQPDVMVLGSHRRYGDTVPSRERHDPSGETVKIRRMVHLWRMILPEKFTLDRWVVQAALDEFLVLPEGVTLGALFEQLEKSEFDCVIGTMLDVYPRSIAALRKQMTEPNVNLDDEWFFDAQPHRVPDTGGFRTIYSGSRARLFHHFLTIPQIPLRRRFLARFRSWLRARRGELHYKYSNHHEKFCLVRWRSGTWMKGSHKISLTPSLHHQLPILHMKFTGDLYRRAQIAIRDKSYYNASQGYVNLVRMLSEMEKRDASFLCAKSASIHDPEAFRKAQLMVGF